MKYWYYDLAMSNVMFTNPNFHEDSFFNKYSQEPPSWFEFLLDASGKKMLIHLENNCEPSAPHLIALFVDKASSHINNTGGAVRQYSNQLWDLASETASYLHWNHDLLSKIPTSIRQKLLSHLVKVTVPEEIRAQDICQVDLKKIPREGLSALYLYHTWICRAFVQLHFHEKPGKNDFEMPGFLPNVNSLQLIEPELSHSMQFLHKIAANPPELTCPQVFSIGKLPKSNTLEYSSQTVSAQVHFDLGELFFYYCSYSEAYSHFKITADLYEKCNSDLLSFTRKKVTSFITGLQFLTVSADIVDQESLVSKLELTKACNYDGCVDILLQDNFLRELSLSHRKAFVKEVHESCRDQSLHKQAFLCNVILEVILGKGTKQIFWDMLKGDKDLVLDFVISATLNYLENPTSENIKANVRFFFLSIMSKRYMKNRVDDVVDRIGSLLDIAFPNGNCSANDATSTKSTLIYEEGELASCYEKLCSTIIFSEIKDCISKICQLQPNFHVQSFCDRVFKDMRKISLFLPLIDYLACPKPLAVILSYKLAHLYNYMQFDQAHRLLTDIKDYLKTAQYAAFKRGQNSRPLDKLEIILKSFVINRSAFLSHHKIKPSDEFFENIAILNINHHSNAGTHSMNFETSIASAVLLNVGEQPTIVEINDGFDFIASQLWNYAKNPSYDLSTLFKLLIPMHSSKPPEGTMIRSMFLEFCYQIADEEMLELLVAVIVKIFNDSEKAEWHNFTCDIITRAWPKLSNSKEADATVCLSTLSRLLDHALQLYPHNIRLLTLSANCKMYRGDNESTIRELLSCGALLSDGFTDLSTLDRWLDGNFYNLVKACMNVNAHIEVALLCCMKNPPDYGTSFQALKRTSVHDTLHQYYPLFWDVNLLECAIAQHHKRGETMLRDYVMGLIGQPEINENNSPSLQKRTSTTKKGLFLRTLLFKYISRE